ncbi:hypothetical protein GPECTOR_56g421 [Gonium pectorale]|uniref:Inositol oxygenase n=1 Tax=Gonium pectorale TaxID=33097 RepID=A0A150G676_GONPE|nr:hypothetical protein GPECTOR_56g421 [Gonium pectorale]|eukprot:KXZ45324.1 hypothetical protein GPECTOR_56g421 [Gonium pectorale]
MKKCRSHTSIAQAASDVGMGLALGAEDGEGYMVASAPENAMCLVDTEDGDDGACFAEEIKLLGGGASGAKVAASGGCSAGGTCGACSGSGTGATGAASASCSPLLRPHSGSSSTALSSFSGASTSPLHTPTPTQQSQDPAKHQAQPASAQQHQELQQSHPLQQQLKQQYGQQTAVPLAPQLPPTPQQQPVSTQVSGGLGRQEGGCAEQARPPGASTGGGCGGASTGVGATLARADSGLMGAFGVLTSEQWDSLQCAIVGSCLPQRASAATEAAVAADAPRRDARSGGASSSSANPAAAARQESAAAQQDSADGGSADSIVSLWAAVNAVSAGNRTVSSSGVFGSTDDNASMLALAAAQGGAGGGGWGPGRLSPIRAVPAVPPTATSPLRFDRMPHQPADAADRCQPGSDHGNDCDNCRSNFSGNGDHQPPGNGHSGGHSNGFTFRHTHHAGNTYGGGGSRPASSGPHTHVSVVVGFKPTTTTAAAAPPPLREPGSPRSPPVVLPSGNSFGAMVGGSSGGADVLVRQRSRTLEGYMGVSSSTRGLAAAPLSGGGASVSAGGAGDGPQPPPPPAAASSSRASFDSAHPRFGQHHYYPNMHGGGAAIATAALRSRHAASATAAAPPPASAGDSVYRSEQAVHQAHHHPQMYPAQHRSLAPPPSYTTYGYRRARSSLAALEQQGCGGGSAVVGGAVVVGQGDDSSSDDDTEEATRRITAAFRTHTGIARSSGWGLLGIDSAPTTPTGEGARRDPWGAVGSQASGSLGTAPGESDGNAGVGKQEGTDGEGEGAAALLGRRRSSYHLTNGHAAVELFLRLNHARQTMDFVKRQTQLFAGLDKVHMGVWEALSLLDELREYEAVLMADGVDAQDVSELSLRDHAFQTAELCRLHHPELDWLHLVGLIHGLGKLLAHKRFGSQPQWAICGETFPLGCRFSPHILGSQYFTANPDRRRRLYNSPTGIYGPGCGLLNVVMSWSAPEYLYLVMLLNGTSLPQDALWVLRHAKFTSLARPHSCYLPLCCVDDLRRLPLLRSFQSLAAYRRAELPPGFALSGAARDEYYGGLIEKYIGKGPLHW